MEIIFQANTLTVSDKVHSPVMRSLDGMLVGPGQGFKAVKSLGEIELLGFMGMLAPRDTLG